MTHFFDGKNYAHQKELDIVKQVRNLNKEKINPKLVTILIGDNLTSEFFVSLKKKYAERVGVELEIVKFSASESSNQPSVSRHRFEELIKLIEKYNNDKKIHGVMVQLPLPDDFSEKDKKRIINSISPEKDVDGLRDDSVYNNPVVKVVHDNISMAEEYIHHNNYPYKIVVVGSKGSFGKKILKSLKTLNSRVYSYLGVDNGAPIEDKTKDADIVISATGKQGIIRGNMVKDGAVLIDVGAPKGDMRKDAYSKASYVSPVPGGVGPAAIAVLIENVVESATKFQ
jgi:methylenetetrahydrofolate dehydrogenase (NADP+)/methenyltetrahydrofolate cyclohydrolase